MLKAIVFDFNGVILNDEPLHFAAMRDTVADFGIHLTREAYWEKYLPFDDTQCLESICRDHSFPLSVKEREEALSRKSHYYQDLLRGGFPLLPGASHFIQAAAEHYPLALASGARREEIETTLECTDLKRYFLAVVAAEDFHLGKPHPESFLLALERLNAALNGYPIKPEECLVIEDSVAGISGARAAGMACMAVTNSYPREALAAANRIINSLDEVRVDSLQDLFGGSE
ncbi:MAG: HAD family phosphatase [Acidobacteria bacterium]|nr:HAD family phosphatase [Acidobacteriota bacterium]